MGPDGGAVVNCALLSYNPISKILICYTCALDVHNILFRMLDLLNRMGYSEFANMTIDCVVWQELRSKSLERKVCHEHGSGYWDTLAGDDGRIPGDSVVVERRGDEGDECE